MLACILFPLDLRVVWICLWFAGFEFVGCTVFRFCDLFVGLLVLIDWLLVILVVLCFVLISFWFYV